MNSRSFILSALMGGAILGTLANLPVLNLINCFLCIWVWVGGALAVVFYHRFQHGEGSLSGGQGAGLGAVAGLIGAFIGLIVYSLTSFISMPIFASVARFFEVEGELPLQSGGLQSVIGTAFFFFLVDAVAYPLFGALGGLLAASLTGKKPASPA